jgi:outer membrane protein assembly factor BamB
LRRHKETGLLNAWPESGLKLKWSSRAIGIGYGGPALVGPHLYLIGDLPDGCYVMALDRGSGLQAWSKRVGPPGGNSSYADGHLYCRSEDGPLALVEATPGGYRENGRFRQPERSSKKAWTHPVIAGGCLYLRDQELLLCYDVKGLD